MYDDAREKSFILHNDKDDWGGDEDNTLYEDDGEQASDQSAAYRKHGAELEGTFDSVRNAFLPMQPFASWTKSPKPQANGWYFGVISAPCMGIILLTRY